MLESLLRAAARLPVAGLVAITGTLSLAESAFLVDLLVPGEASMIFMGAIASERDAPLAFFVVACVAGALAGDSLSYLIGRRWGRAITSRWDWSKRLVEPKIDRAERFVERNRGAAVFAGRWVGALRAVVPLVAGSSRMRFRTFIAWDLLAALTWGTTVVAVGYVIGRPAVRLVDRFEWVVPVAVAVGAVAWWLGRRRRRNRN